MLNRLDEGLHHAPAPLSFMGLRVGTRMTIVELPDAGLLVHSPIPLDASLREAVDALGPVRHVVAPNVFHHLFAGAWIEAYPDAVLHAPAALRKKRPDLRVDAALGDAPHPGWGGALTPIPIEGTLLHETVLVHHASGTVISADLTENFDTSDHWLTRWYLKSGGIHGRIGVSRWLRLAFRDRPATRRSIDALLAQEFDRVIVAHGDIVPRDGPEAVRRTYAFL